MESWKITLTAGCLAAFPVSSHSVENETGWLNCFSALNIPSAASGRNAYEHEEILVPIDSIQFISVSKEGSYWVIYFRENNTHIAMDKDQCTVVYSNSILD